MLNSSLYREEGIVFDKDWINKYNTEIAQDKNHGNNESFHSELVGKNVFSCITSVNLDNDEELNEDEEEIPAGVTDTLFTATDFLEDNERQNIVNVAS